MPIRPEILARKTAPEKYVEVLGLRVPVFSHGAMPPKLAAELQPWLSLATSDDPGRVVEATFRMLAAFLQYAPPEDRLTYEELVSLPLTQEELWEVVQALSQLLVGGNRTEAGEAGGEPAPNLPTPSTAS